jgi:RNA polymerase sigma factor (sigma-70 family)
MRLSSEQSKLVEENMGLVGQVIKDKVRDVRRIGIFSYDDLFQIGCIGLCKAAATHESGRGRFSTYAYVIIRNEIFAALEYATVRRIREATVDSEQLESQHGYYDVPDNLDDVADIIGAAKSRASGVTAKGIEAIELLTQGYTNREIGERMGASANNVTAWVARARKFLRADPALAALKES